MKIKLHINFSTVSGRSMKKYKNRDCIECGPRLQNELRPHSFYTVLYEKCFYIDKPVKDCGNEMLKMKFLHLRGAKEFKWPLHDDVDTVH